MKISYFLKPSLKEIYFFRYHLVCDLMRLCASLHGEKCFDSHWSDCSGGSSVLSLLLQGKISCKNNLFRECLSCMLNQLCSYQG